MVVNRSGQKQIVGPGKIRDCTVKMEGGECALVLCKEDLTTISKLACDWYMPKHKTSALAEAMINKEKTRNGRYRILLEDIIDQLFEAYRDNPEKHALTVSEFCRAPGVTCWKNSKMFPIEDFRKLTSDQLIIKKVVKGPNEEEFEIQFSDF